MSRRTRRTVLPALAVSAALVLAACASAEDAGSPASGSAGPGVSVVATTTILGDLTGQLVACAGGTSSTLMPVGADPHDFTPSSEQVAALVTADLVVANGLGLEEGLEDALDGAATDGARVLEVAPLLDPIEFGAGGHADEGEEHADEGEEHADEGEEHADEHGSEDPHVWFDMERMAVAAELIAAELGEVSGDAEGFAACGAELAAELRATEVEVRAILESVPADRRILVTDHDALGYLAERYGYEIVGTVIPAGTTLAQPSSEDLAALAAIIQDEGVTAIFANTAESSKLSEAVAAEAGVDVAVVPLFVGSLGEPGSGADTYQGMMLTDAELIAAALQG
jgi:zinc/manganese transport system substrate-binding protein